MLSKVPRPICIGLASVMPPESSTAVPQIWVTVFVESPKAVLLALAATCYHAIAIGGQRQALIAPGLIVGHGVMGRLLARITLALGMPMHARARAPSAALGRPDRRRPVGSAYVTRRMPR